MKRWALGIACVVSIALCGVLGLQRAGIVPPLLVGWGDPVKARGYTAGLDGALLFRVGWGFTQPAPGRAGSSYGAALLQHFNALGISWNRWNMTLGRTPNAPVLANTAELYIGIGWPIVVSLLLATLWWLHSARQRRLAKSGQFCAKCGYDLRATPERCPECGTVRTA